MILPLLAFLTLTILAYLGVDWIRRLAIRRRIVDHPNERSSHSVPTPRGGGLAIVVLVIGTVLFFGFVNGFDRQSLVYVVAGILLAWLGWQDDVSSLSSRMRFAVQAMAVTLAMLGLGYFKSVTIPLFGELYLGWVGIPVTFFWILGLINAYNFMDGLDGFAGGVALAAGLGWTILSSTFGGLENPLAFWIALSIAASSLGFLGHNWPPARIFMGDVASTFLGFSFAVLPLGHGTISPAAAGSILTIFATMFVSALKIAAPIVGAVFLTDISLGILARTVPQLNVFVVGFPAKLAVALFAVIIVMPMAFGVMTGLFTSVHHDLLALLRNLGGG